MIRTLLRSCRWLLSFWLCLVRSPIGDFGDDGVWTRGRWDSDFEYVGTWALGDWFLGFRVAGFRTRGWRFRTSGITCCRNRQ
ncbi:hypothetical protein BCT97_015430 [Vibrio breoganii]|uniref:hypothetical protein n=1 Tax=Vibrio breoganii TaxID=553239 RepID=UPI0039B06177